MSLFIRTGNQFSVSFSWDVHPKLSQILSILFFPVDVLKVLEDGDLQTLGLLDYDKRLQHSFTAHPKVDPFTGKALTLLHIRNCGGKSFILGLVYQEKCSPLATRIHPLISHTELSRRMVICMTQYLLQYQNQL